MIAMLANGEAELIAQLLIALVFGGICAVIANARGRSGVAWFFIGCIFSCLALILLLCLPDLKQQQDREERQRQENRRLREQIAKERQVSDLRHNEVHKRLGAHDQALGLDTSTAAEIGNGDAPPPLLSGATQGASWYYARDNQRHGPVSAETIQHLLAAQAITRDSLVWRQGMQDWKPIRDVTDFDGAQS